MGFKNKKISVIGAGNMGKPIIQGILRSSYEHLCIVDPNKERVSAFSSFDKGVYVLESIDERVLQSDIIVLAVKPQELKSIGRALFDGIKDDVVLVTILAGVSIANIQKVIGCKRVIRAMPNITASVCCSPTVLCFSDLQDKGLSDIGFALFQLIGEVFVSEENKLNAVTGLSGSGPAYIYMVIEALSDGGVKMGLPRDLSLKLATQTVMGAAKLVKDTGLHPAILRDQVTTPGGTTISAIHELESHGLRSMLISAVVTAAEKSKDLDVNPSQEEDQNE